jgi:pyruvate/2-oxoglutarate dehydrogenase complex dihydrolipoamide acyltransferase (E2) component
MPSEVKMPQLGMNQDSAVIVAWLKTAGEAVTTGDVLFEVETDKSTVEVEAAADGFLSGILAPDGAEVPVGDVIAMIVDSEAEVTASSSTPDHSEPEPAHAPEPDQAPEPAQNEAKIPVSPAIVSPAMPTGKVLASPLAKRVASERGIDLAGLRASGVVEPIHVADLKRASSARQSILTARAAADALTALLERSDGANRSNLFAAFAAGAWRAVFQGAAIGVAIRGLDGTITEYPGEGTTEIAMSLVDLCDTRLTSFAPVAGGMTLAAARDGPCFALTLSFTESSLPLQAAVALLDAIAARVEDPIRQLL